MNQHLKRAWAEISVSNLKSNISVIKNIVGDKIMAVVKADAYGHGEGEICHYLKESGVKYFAVSNLDEALRVKNFCPESEVLILGYTYPEYADELAENNIIQGVISREYALELVKNTDKKIRCHIKIDTGMGRIGLKYDTPEQCAEEIKNIINIDNLSVEGIYTHFAVADSYDEDNIKYTDKQEKFILDTYDILKSENINLEHVHFMNSAASCYRTNPRSTLARTGIIMYGLSPNYPLEIPSGLKPVMSLKAIISHVKKVQKGDCISYGRTFTAEHDMDIATVTIGYADGYSRLLSSKADVILKGKRCRITGRICMDQLMIDVTEMNAKEGDIVTLIGSDGNETITADELASIYGTIGYEVVCGISKRVPRIYVK